MAGSHRAPQTRRGRSSAVPPWAIAVAVVVALIPATWFAAQRVFDDGSPAPATTSTDRPIPPVSPSTSPTPSSTPPATAPASPGTVTAANLPTVSPDAPRRIVSGTALDAGFDDAVTSIEPASTNEVARWEPRGSPGSPGTDTVYVVGKMTADGDSAFGRLPELKAGSTVAIRTDSGTMTYTVSASTLEATSGLTDDPLFTEHSPGRLVLVGIRYAASGDRLDRALVVTARLTGANR